MKQLDEDPQLLWSLHQRESGAVWVILNLQDIQKLEVEGSRGM